MPESDLFAHINMIVLDICMYVCIYINTQTHTCIHIFGAYPANMGSVIIGQHDKNVYM